MEMFVAIRCEQIGQRVDRTSGVRESLKGRSSMLTTPAENLLPAKGKSW
jgi:hypothetical protein